MLFIVFTGVKAHETCLKNILCFSFENTLFNLKIPGYPEGFSRVPVDPGNRDYPGNFPSRHTRFPTLLGTLSSKNAFLINQQC